MMNIETGSYVSLNGTGKSIWDLLDEAKTINQIVDELTSQYSITRELCEKDVLPFIEQLLEQKIIIEKV